MRRIFVNCSLPVDAEVTSKDINVTLKALSGITKPQIMAELQITVSELLSALTRVRDAIRLHKEPEVIAKAHPELIEWQQSVHGEAERKERPKFRPLNREIPEPDVPVPARRLIEEAMLAKYEDGGEGEDAGESLQRYALDVKHRWAKPILPGAFSNLATRVWLGEAKAVSEAFNIYYGRIGGPLVAQQFNIQGDGKRRDSMTFEQVIEEAEREDDRKNWQGSETAVLESVPVGDKETDQEE